MPCNLTWKLGEQTYGKLGKELIGDEVDGLGQFIVGFTEERGGDTARDTLVDGTTDLGGLAWVLQDTDGVGQNRAVQVSGAEAGDKLSNAVGRRSSVPVLWESFGDVADGSVVVGLHTVERRDRLVVGDTASTLGTVTKEGGDERVLAEHDEDGVRVEKELVVVRDRLGGVLGVKGIGGSQVELAPVLLGELDESLESVRVGIVVISVVGEKVASHRRNVTLASRVTRETKLSTCLAGADTRLRVRSVVFSAEREGQALDVTAKSSGDKDEQSGEVCAVSTILK